jgi:hypothetical protein
MVAIGVLGNEVHEVVAVEHELASGRLVGPDGAGSTHAQEGRLAQVEMQAGLVEAKQGRSSGR